MKEGIQAGMPEIKAGMGVRAKFLPAEKPSIYMMVHDNYCLNMSDPVRFASGMNTAKIFEIYKKPQWGQPYNDYIDNLESIWKAREPEETRPELKDLERLAVQFEKIYSETKNMIEDFKQSITKGDKTHEKN